MKEGVKSMLGLRSMRGEIPLQEVCGVPLWPCARGCAHDVYMSVNAGVPLCMRVCLSVWVRLRV